VPVSLHPSRLTIGISVVVILLASSSVVPRVFAQASWDAQLVVDPYPSAYLSDWETNPTISTLTITNPTGQDRAVSLVYRVTDQAGQVLANGRSDAQTLPPGATTYTSFVDISGSSSHDANLEGQMRRTGRLPEGDYTVCVVATDQGGFVLAETCAHFAIVYPDPPLLVAPLDDDALSTTQPLFQWTPLQVPVAYRVQYVLRIAEVMAHQTPDEALRANIPWFENYDVGAPNLSYPISARAFETGRTYAWRVQALDQYGYPPSANDGLSEVRTFRYDEPGVPAPPSQVTLSVANLRNASGAPADTALGLSEICQNFDSTTVGVSQFHFGINSPIAFPASLNLKAVLHRYVTPDNERVWALVGDVPQSTPLRVLVYGSCDDHAAGWMPGAKWLGIRTVAGAASSQWLMVNSDSTVDSTSQAQADSASRVSGPGFEFGAVVFTLQETTIAAPDGFTPVRDFLEAREFDAKPGVNVLAVQQLEEGSAWDFFRWMGYDQKELTFYGFAGVNTALNVGFGRSRDGGFANASAEVEFVNLRLAFPTREPPALLHPFFKSMHLELELAVKDTILNLMEPKSSHQFHLVMGLNHRIELTDTLIQAMRLNPGASLVGTFSVDLSKEQKPGSTELKVAFKYALDATWTIGETQFVVGHIEVEIGRMLYGANTGDVSLSVSGSVGWGPEESLGKLSVTVGRQPKPRFLAMLDGMRDNITRWQDRRVFTMGELVMARTAADSAKLNGYIKQYEEWIATEEDQLKTFQNLNTTVDARKNYVNKQPHCLGKAGWFCTFRLSFGNMSLVDMLALVRGAGQ
jgi:hypothetical protein